MEQARRAGVGTAIGATVVVGTAPLGTGGLGRAAAEFVDGLRSFDRQAAYVGPPRPGLARRVAMSRGFRRAFGVAPSRQLKAYAVRRAVPAGGWDLAFAMPETVPVERGRGLRVVHQATRHPALEWEALRRAERATGGRGDMSTAERRRREYELERADLVHVTSLAVHDEMLAAGLAAERLVHAPFGVDLERYTPGAKSATEMTIAFVGPMSLRKGVDTVAELAARLGGEARVETVGGPACPWSRRIYEAAPFVHRDSVPRMLATANVLVAPSRSDGFSYVVLEALASGTVPIVTPEVGAAEIVGRLDPRLVVAREDFVEATLDLLPRLDLAALAPAARRLAEQFDRRRTAPAIVAAVLERAELWR